MRAPLFACIVVPFGVWGATGCAFQGKGVVPEVDGAVAPEPDSPPACVSFSAQLDTCTLPPAADLALAGDLVFDTNAGTLQQDATALAVIALPKTVGGVLTMTLVAESITLAPDTRLRVVGPIPLTIVARGSITLGDGARIDASEGGAGARSACAPNGAAAGMERSGGGGGGGGGGFGALGGRGGNGNSDGDEGTGGGGGQQSTVPNGPLGGCPGNAGGAGSNSGGGGGLAGGALDVIAAIGIELAINSALTVGGGGGGGGNQTIGNYGDAGGGGGGAGGTIIVEAPYIRGAGSLAANGGGGGQGSGDFDAGRAGAVGGWSTELAPGGSGGGSSGSSGGAGGSKPEPIGGSVTATTKGGGGGGGGSVGFVIVMSPDVTVATLSPDPS